MTTSIPKAKRAYLWVAPRGFGNEGTVYVIPADQTDTALATLATRYDDDGNAHYTVLDNGRDAVRHSMKEYAGWAHSPWFDYAHGDPMEDTIAASRWLYDGSR